MQQSSNPIYAALDIGSNSFRLLIGTFSCNINILSKKLFTVRLAEGLADSGKINIEAMNRAIVAFRSMATILREHNIKHVRICGTEALRRADNSNDLLSECEKILGFPLEIIDGKQEAELCRAGVFSGLSISEDNVLIVDVGGGSSECIFSDISPVPPVSLPIGAVSLTNDFFQDGRHTFHSHEKAQAFVQRLFFPYLTKIKPLVSSLVACGGTATALASLHLGLEQYDEDLVQGTILTSDELKDIFTSLMHIKVKERCQLPGLDHGRGEIILGGALIFIALQNFLQTDGMIISDRGLLEGIFLSQI